MAARPLFNPELKDQWTQNRISRSHPASPTQHASTPRRIRPPAAHSRQGRADLAKKNGDFNSPTDQHLVRFLGLDLAALQKELAKGIGDGEALAWVNAHAKTPRNAWEIEAWSAYMEKRSADSDAETLEGFAEYVGQHSKTREDIKSWFDALDLDDYASFGGKP
jgi:hypothetical protein